MIALGSELYTEIVVYIIREASVVWISTRVPDVLVR